MDERNTSVNSSQPTIIQTVSNTEIIGNHQQQEQQRRRRSRRRQTDRDKRSNNKQPTTNKQQTTNHKQTTNRQPTNQQPNSNTQTKHKNNHATMDNQLALVSHGTSIFSRQFLVCWFVSGLLNNHWL